MKQFTIFVQTGTIWLRALDQPSIWVEADLRSLMFRRLPSLTTARTKGLHADSMGSFISDHLVNFAKKSMINLSSGVHSLNYIL